MELDRIVNYTATHNAEGVLAFLGSTSKEASTTLAIKAKEKLGEKPELVEDFLKLHPDRELVLETCECSSTKKHTGLEKIERKTNAILLLLAVPMVLSFIVFIISVSKINK